MQKKWLWCTVKPISLETSVNTEDWLANKTAKEVVEKGIIVLKPRENLS